MTNVVEHQRVGTITELRLNRPEKLNAFNTALVDDLLTHVIRCADDGTRLLVIRGNGRGFSGGFDLDGLDELSDGDMLLRFVQVEKVLQAVYHAPFATLALAHGAGFGAAADLVSVCEYRVAAPGARFRMPGPKFDVVLGTRRLTHLVGADQARNLILREVPFDHDEAYASGFVTELAPQADWDSVIERINAKVMGFSAQVYADLAARKATDTRDADMAALVRSVSEGSITARLREYVQSVSKPKR
ncbi:MAG: enoyl-CoA hydratase/isomerase family protein [Pseudomonadota bacterium]